MSSVKKAISFLFNIKSSAFVVLSVDIKALSNPLPFNLPQLPTPYCPPTGLSLLNLLSHPLIHLWFEDLRQWGF